MKKDWEFRNLGFVVSDMDKAMEYYKSLGIATIGPELPIRRGTVEGSKLRYRYIQIGSLVFQFCQPVEGETRQLAFLRKHGDGIEHMTFKVADVDAEVNDLVSQGVKLMHRGTMPGGSKMAYFDTGQVGDVLIELVQPAEKDTFADNLKQPE